MFLDRFESLLLDPPPAMAFEISPSGVAAARVSSKTEIEFHSFHAPAIAASPLQENVLDPPGSSKPCAR